MIISNFERYTPKEHSLLGFSGVMFLQSDDGKDWYECQKLFGEDTLKVVYDTSGYITSSAIDVSTLWPAGMSVAEFSLGEVPEGFNQDGHWVYADGKIVPMPVDPKLIRNNLLNQAVVAIAPLEDAVEYKVATDAEIAKLKEWKLYRLALSRLDLTSEFTWPTQPK